LALFKIGEKDREGRQKRIEHTGRYLRASRTGGVALRAQARVGAVNVTGHTGQGVRVSTQLAKNTQVAFQNGRFILRGRYGSDAAKLNVSKSGVSVSTKTGIGAINWLRPGASSAKLGGVQVRGRNALVLQAIYLPLAATASLLRLAGHIVLGMLRLVLLPITYIIERRQRAAAERERLDIDAADVAPIGESILADRSVDPSRESRRDLFAAVAFCVIALGRGRGSFDPDAAGMAEPDSAARYALADDVRAVGEQITAWLGDTPENAAPEEPLGILHALGRAFAHRAEKSLRAETLLSLDDACLAAGPRTVLQEAMLDVLADALAVKVALEEPA